MTDGKLTAELQMFEHPEKIEKPKTSFTLQELIDDTQQNLFHYDISPNNEEFQPPSSLLPDQIEKAKHRHEERRRPNLKGKIAGIPFHSFEQFTDLISSIFTYKQIPGTRIPIKADPFNYFSDEEKPTLQLFLELYISQKRDFSSNQHMINLLASPSFQHFLQNAFIEPLKKLSSSTEPNSLDCLDSELKIILQKKFDQLSEEEIFQIANYLGKTDWNKLNADEQKLILNCLDTNEQPVTSDSTIISTIGPYKYRLCHNSETYFHSQGITINGTIHTKQLEWTSATVIKPFATKAGLLIPGVLLLPDHNTSIAIGLAYAQKGHKGNLASIKNIELPSAAFKIDRPVQTNKRTELMESLSNRQN